MHKTLIAFLIASLATTRPFGVRADDAAPTGPLPPTMRASFCAQLRGLNWRDPGDRAIASCVFTGNPADPYSCGLRLGHHNGVSLGAPREVEWLPATHEEMLIDEDAMNMLLRIERRLVQRPEISMRARALAVEHAYFRAAASVLRTKRPDLVAQARSLSASAESAAAHYLETSSEANSLIPVNLAPIESCPDVLSALMRPIEAERRAAQAAETRRLSAHALAERLRAELAAMPEDSPDRGRLVARYREALRREYEPQIAAARAQAAALEAEARRYPGPETNRRLAELDRLRAAVAAAPQERREAAARDYERALAQERRRPLSPQERAYLDFAAARQSWLRPDAMERHIAADQVFTQRRERGRQEQREIGAPLAALVPVRETILRLDRTERAARYAVDDAAASAHQAVGETIRLPGRVTDAAVSGVGDAWQALGRQRTWDELGENAAALTDDVRRAAGAPGAWLNEVRSYWNLPPEQRAAIDRARNARIARDAQSGLLEAWRGSVTSIRAQLAQYERDSRRRDQRDAVLDSTVPSLSPRDPREALRATGP